ncbi:inosine triphosphate pyrophosphatase-like protein [Lasiosphaeria miniovina]|uniref:inosine/xanthosine triphosphatase n=1 Tax=Lasiosphaeria miniovina TaxID=1954250 RepID=A0AA40ADD2_9PEZI|nr:inosine triphosphate pyrophosphatase-like protein [Lasiosphaeria miniovina]KAK0713755.1 inosine triphosphate pyrophosphatase-like protein [Lasiosphaeria miniovina]
MSGTNNTGGATPPHYKIAVGSLNPVKIDAALEGFRSVFPSATFSATGVLANPGVDSQPLSDGVAFLGAWNRARHVFDLCPDANYWVGIQGGVQWDTYSLNTGEGKGDGGQLQAFSWIVVLGGDRGELMGKARTATHYLPSDMSHLMHFGYDLGLAHHQAHRGIDYNPTDGSVGLLTHGIYGRDESYLHAIILALIPHRNPTVAF